MNVVMDEKQETGIKIKDKRPKIKVLREI